MLFIALSLFLQDQSDKSKSDDDWRRGEDIVYSTYKQKDNIFHYCCSGSYSVFFLFYFIGPLCLSAVCFVAPFPTNLEMYY